LWARRNDDIQRFRPGFRKGREGETMALPAIPRRARNCYVAPAIPWIGGVR